MKEIVRLYVKEPYCNGVVSKVFNANDVVKVSQKKHPHVVNTILAREICVDKRSLYSNGKIERIISFAIGTEKEWKKRGDLYSPYALNCHS